ncbi:MAG: hypothetical protein JNK14_20485 [Chitinophagaceae bacterium]|nr:hypothetical protein [Chitinophagaceae bacterium]
MKKISLAFTLLITVSLHGQFYYKDIIGSKETSQKMKAFAAAGVQSVTATGYDPRGAKTTDFNEWQDVQANGTILKITTRSGQIAGRIYHTFDSQARLIMTRDSSAGIQNITQYGYDTKDKLLSAKTTVQDDGKEFNETEEHLWQYNTAGKPEKMWRIVNGTDSTEYRFTLNEQGNVADETLYRRYKDKDTVYYYIYENQRVYYYYDEQNRLTDIVRYDKKTKQLLPDVIFEYDEQNNIIQRITTLTTWPPDYLEWRYLYNEKGLKTKEALFSKNKDLKGRIEYAYTFKE